MDKFIESFKCSECGINCDISSYQFNNEIKHLCPECFDKLNDTIIIEDWAGNILFEGDCDDPQVDKVLDANRCTCDENREICDECNGTGYKGDFEVKWVYEDDRNVYEYINY